MHKLTLEQHVGSNDNEYWLFLLSTGGNVYWRDRGWTIWRV